MSVTKASSVELPLSPQRLPCPEVSATSLIPILRGHCLHVPGIKAGYNILKSNHRSQSEFLGGGGGGWKKGRLGEEKCYLVDHQSL